MKRGVNEINEIKEAEAHESHLSYVRPSAKQSYWCAASMLSRISMLAYLSRINAFGDWTLTQDSWPLVSDEDGQNLRMPPATREESHELSGMNEAPHRPLNARARLLNGESKSLSARQSIPHLSPRREILINLITFIF